MAKGILANSLCLDPLYKILPTQAACFDNSPKAPLKHTILHGTPNKMLDIVEGIKLVVLIQHSFGLLLIPMLVTLGLIWQYSKRLLIFFGNSKDNFPVSLEFAWIKEKEKQIESK